MKNTYKYSCKVEINDKNTLKELYDYLRHYKYVVDKPYQSVGKYLANILVTVNDKDGFHIIFIIKNMKVMLF